ncbi:MAG: DeoR family transcriptional regulator [Patescibacteria group bacterium]
MLSRKDQLLRAVIESYTKKAEPVGSHTLEGELGVSSATIRNDMVELENEGFLTQPHTSAGRIPTTLGYEYFVNKLASALTLKTSEQNFWQEIIGPTKAPDLTLKNLARELAEISGVAAMIGFAPNDVYYTGLANLFAQPEFAHIKMVREFSSIIDHLEEAMEKLWRDGINKELVQIKLGQNNPFSEDCAVIFTWLPTTQNNKNLLGLLGPTRLDYETNLGRLQFINSIFNPPTL